MYRVKSPLQELRRDTVAIKEAELVFVYIKQLYYQGLFDCNSASTSFTYIHTTHVLSPEV
jgi:hypothetical protein